MAKKADLEVAYSRHDNLCRQAATLEAQSDYRSALQRAESGLSTLRDALTYQRRYLKVAQPPLTAADRIMRLAPPLFARRSLDALEAYCDGRAKAERAAFPGLTQQLAAARQTLALAVRLWSEMNVTPAAPIYPPATDRTSAGITDVWLAMGLVVRAGPAGATVYKVVTDLWRDAVGKCSGCGCIRQAAAVQLLEPMACPSCNERRSFVITRRVL